MTDSFRTIGAVQGFTQRKQGLLLECGGPQVAIAVLTERIVRVRLALEGGFAARRSWAVTPEDESFAPVAFELTETEEALILKTAALSVEVSRSTGQISSSDSQGQVFCADAAGMGWRGKQVAGSKRIEAGEHFYGFGERADQLDQTGRQITNWTTDRHRYGPGTDPLYIAIPVFMALRPGLAYGVFLNNTWRSQFDMGATQGDMWRMSAEGGELDYYVVYGPKPADVLAGFGQLLGTTPLPPRWALGYHQSRYSYESEAEVRALVAELRSRQIPADVIHLDIHHMTGYRDFTWDPERFPNPEKLITDLKQEGLRVVTIADPGVKIDPEYEVYQDGLKGDRFIRQANGEVFHGYVWPDDSVFADFTRPEVRQWWGQMQARMVTTGVAGIWNDMNEPTVFELPFSQGGGAPKGIDMDAVQGSADEQTTHAEVHNLYGSGMSQASYEGLRQSKNERPFVLTRSGFAGIQRWSACWMGDNTARWEHLEMAMPQLMNMGLSGVPFSGTDIGGFFDNTSDELFARWMQFGALMPFSRGHTHFGTAPHEPWAFGARVEAICKEYLQLRYHWLPYFYTLFWETAQTGAPVLRPLLYEFPEDQTTYQLHDQVMLGPSILAAPVYQPGREHRAVYLPKGEWYDHWTEQVIVGPTHFLAEAPLERMPLYIRGGAIVPSGPQLNFADEKALDPLTLDFYGGEGSFTLYDDDGLSFEYEQGQFCTTHYAMRRTESGLRIEGEARTGLYQPARRTLIVRVHGVAEEAAKHQAKADYDSARRILSITLEDDGQGWQLEI